MSQAGQEQPTDKVVDKENVMRERNIITASPEERATYIWNIINKHNPRPTTWDIVCFCCESLAVVANEHEWLKPFARRLVSMIYTAHYFSTLEPFPSAISKGENKQEEAIQFERIEGLKF